MRVKKRRKDKESIADPRGKNRCGAKIKFPRRLFLRIREFQRKPCVVRQKEGQSSMYAYRGYATDKPTGSTAARVKGELPFQEGGPFGETAEDGGEGAVRA